jgi:hypothetical protein
LLALLIIALCAAGAGYYEAAKLEARDGAGPWGLEPTVCGLACLVIGFMAAVVFQPLVVGVVVGVAGFEQATRYEELRQSRLAGKPARMWGIAIGLFVLVVAILTSVVLVAGIAVGAGLVGGLFLVQAERDEIVAERNALRVEKDALLAEKRTLIAEKSRRPAAAAPAHEESRNYSNAVAAALRAEKPAPRINVVALHGEGDLLPRSVSSGAGGNDLLPRR